MRIIKESYWINLASMKACTVCSIAEPNANGEWETKWLFKGDKPFPVIGKFNISYDKLCEWLKANGWQRRNQVLPISAPDATWCFDTVNS